MGEHGFRDPQPTPPWHESISNASKATVRSTVPQHSLPSPPHIPLNCTSYGKGAVKPQALGSWSTSVAGYDLSALEMWTSDSRLDTNISSSLDWSYEKRHTPHSIFPFLYLGPLSASMDHGYLKQENITAVISIRWNPKRDLAVPHGTLATGLSIPRQMSLETSVFEVRDLQDFTSQLNTIVAVIARHLHSGLALLPETERADILRSFHQRLETHAQLDGASTDGDRSADSTTDLSQNINVPPPPRKLLIVCETGNERSAAAAAAFIIAGMPHMNFTSAMQWIQTKRFCANFSEDTKHYLRNFGDLVDARRDAGQDAIAQANRASGVGGNSVHVGAEKINDNGPGRAKVKRAWGVDDEEMEDADQDDQDRFLGRKPFVPFQDADGDSNMGL